MHYVISVMVEWITVVTLEAMRPSIIGTLWIGSLGASFHSGEINGFPSEMVFHIAGKEQIPKCTKTVHRMDHRHEVSVTKPNLDSAHINVCLLSVV